MRPPRSEVWSCIERARRTVDRAALLLAASRELIATQLSLYEDCRAALNRPPRAGPAFPPA